MNEKGKTIIAIIVILIIIGVLGKACGATNEYEEAGNSFGQWIREDPNTWSDTEKQYFNDFMEWSDKN